MGCALPHSGRRICNVQQCRQSTWLHLGTCVFETVISTRVPSVMYAESRRRGGGAVGWAERYKPVTRMTMVRAGSGATARPRQREPSGQCHGSALAHGQRDHESGGRAVFGAVAGAARFTPPCSMISTVAGSGIWWMVARMSTSCCKSSTPRRVRGSKRGDGQLKRLPQHRREPHTVGGRRPSKVRPPHLSQQGHRHGAQGRALAVGAAGVTSTQGSANTFGCATFPTYGRSPLSANFIA